MTTQAHKDAVSAIVAALATAGFIPANSNACSNAAPSFNVDAAYDVLESLREQPGVQPLKHGVWQYLIEGKTDDARIGGVRLEVRKRRDRSVKLSRAFSPAFETEAQALAAISAVGEQEILTAMKALAAA